MEAIVLLCAFHIGFTCFSVVGIKPFDRCVDGFVGI